MGGGVREPIPSKRREKTKIKIKIYQSGFTDHKTDKIIFLNTGKLVINRDKMLKDKLIPNYKDKITY